MFKTEENRLNIDYVHVYTTMGRGRSRPIDRSLKKPKIHKGKERGESMWWGWTNNDKRDSLFLPEDFVESMKQMNPQQLAEFLLNK